MKRGRVFFSVLGYLGIAAGAVNAQTAIPVSGSVEVRLATGQKQTLELTAQPGTVVLLRLDLRGGLVAVQTAEAPRCIMDLGMGGQLLYAVTSSAEGVARIEFSSAEQSRQASLTVRDASSAYSEKTRQHLLAAGVSLAKADSARRKLPGAPDTQAALKLYDLAIAEAQAARAVPLARWAMTQKARFLIYQRSSFLDARVLLNQAVALPPDDDDAVQALTYKSLGADAYFLGDLSAATFANEKSLSLYRKTGDLYWQGIMLGNLISLYGEAGRVDDAIAVGQEALDDSEQTEDPAGVVFTLTELGTLYREQGHYDEAFQTFRQAIAWSESIHYAPLIEAEVEKDLGSFYLDIGLSKEAEEQLHLCLSHASTDSQAALDARGMLARVLEETGRTEDALREYASAIGIARSLRLKPEEVTLLLRRSRTLLQTSQVQAAENDVSQASQLTDKLNIPALVLETKLAEGAVKERICPSCPETRQVYEQALLLAYELGEREQEATADAALARVFEAQHEDAAALNAVGSALTIVEHSRSSLPTQDLAASYFFGRRSWYDLALELSMRLDKRSPGKGFDAMAFRYAEQARARTMLDAMGEAGGPEKADLPVHLQQRILANRVLLEKEKALLLNSSDPQAPAATLRSLYLEGDALAAEVHNQPGQQSRLRSDWTASARDVQQSLLRPGEALIAFSQGSRHSYRWLITRASISVASLPAQRELQHHLDPLLKMLLDRKPQLEPGEDIQHYRGRSSLWNQSRDDALLAAGRLLVPALPATVRHLYVVADGSLLSIPWSALRQPCGNRVCYAVERYAISIEPSVSVAVALDRSRISSAAENVLVVADTIAASEHSMPRWTSLTPLPGTRREAESIARLVPTAHLRQLRGKDATVENVRALMQPSLSILHLSTHTLLVTGHPELSGIALSSGGVHLGKGQSVLWLRDIPSLHAPPLVTLSGCTTQGRSLSGEELVTLTQAFFYGGAHQVIGSIWNVDDEATSMLMADFYRRLLKDKLNVSEAMRRTQVSMLHNHEPLPDWAGFVVNGVQPVAVAPVPEGN